MSKHVFFSTDNRHNERVIRILSVGSLVSKPPTKEKRISIKVRMPLSTGGTGTGTMGAPEWLDEAYRYVASHGGDKITPDLDLKGYALEFSVENLFGEPILSNDSIMRGFEIVEMGNEEAPDVVLGFCIRVPFSASRWQWLGQFVGEDVWVKFTPGEAGTVRVETEQDGTLLDDGENDEDEDNGEDAAATHDEDEADAEEESGDPRLTIVGGKKSGPKDLADFHSGQLQAAAKKGQRRLAKPQVDPLTVNSIEDTAF